jgi:hypothetical protein
MDFGAEPLLDPLPAPQRGALVASVGSLAGHLALVALALLVAQPRPLVAPPLVAIEVDLVQPPPEQASRPAPKAPQPASPATGQMPSAPGESAEPSTSAPEAAGAPEARNTPSGKVFTATRLYTGKLLTEPKMAKVRRELGNLAGSERVVQLCNIEALEQIRLADPGSDPDTLVGYAFSDLEQHGLRLSASGGAFRSRRHWYAITYSCTAGNDLASIAAFRFQLGDEIPQSEWEAHNLTAADADE